MNSDAPDTSNLQFAIRDDQRDRAAVKRIAEAARSFVRVYDEFEDDPTCIGEDLAVLIDAVDDLGKVDGLQPKCCKLECGADAKWQIVTGASPDDYTESCTAHVGDLLTDAPAHSVYRLPRPGEAK